MTGKKTRRSYVYRAEFERGAKRGNIIVTFPDVPEVVTQGRGETDAREMAEEALGLVLLTYLERGMPLPKPRRCARWARNRWSAWWRRGGVTLTPPSPCRAA